MYRALHSQLDNALDAFPTYHTMHPSPIQVPRPFGARIPPRYWPSMRGRRKRSTYNHVLSSLPLHLLLEDGLSGAEAITVASCLPGTQVEPHILKSLWLCLFLPVTFPCVGHPFVTQVWVFDHIGTKFNQHLHLLPPIRPPASVTLSPTMEPLLAQVLPSFNCFQTHHVHPIPMQILGNLA